MTDRYIIDGSEIINHSNTEWEIALYFKDNRLNKKYELKDFIKLVNDMNKELMDLRLENTKNKLVFRGIVEDLEEQAKSKEPVITSMDYVDWIKEHSDLRLNGEKCLDNDKKRVSVTLDDGFGRVQTSIKSKYSAPNLMDKIVEEYDNDKE